MEKHKVLLTFNKNTICENKTVTFIPKNNKQDELLLLITKNTDTFVNNQRQNENRRDNFEQVSNLRPYPQISF